MRKKPLEEETEQKEMHEAVENAWLVVALSKKEAIRIGLSLALLVILGLGWAVNRFMPDEE